MFQPVIIPKHDEARQVELCGEDISCFASNGSGDVLDLGPKLAKIFMNHREAIPNVMDGFHGWRAKIFKRNNQLANWLKVDNHLSGTTEKLNDVDIACSRGFLIRVGTSLTAHHHEAWRAEALNVNGVIFIALVIGDQDEKLTKEMLMRKYAEERFLESLTSPTTTAESPDEATSSYEGAADCFSVVRKATFSSRGNELKTLFIGKVDCLSKKDGKKIALRLVQPNRFEKKGPTPSYLKKCSKWLLESRLMEIEQMYLGEYDGTSVGKIQLVRMGSEQQASLSPDEQLFLDISIQTNQMLQRIEDVLRFIKNSLPNDNDCCFVEKKRYTAQLAITEKKAIHLRFLNPRTREDILSNPTQLKNNICLSTKT